MTKDWMITSVLRGRLIEKGFDSEINYDINNEEDTLDIFVAGFGKVANANLKGSGYYVLYSYEGLEELLKEYNDSKREAFERGEIQ